MTVERLTWRTTLDRLRGDRRRLSALLERQRDGRAGPLLLHPAFLCVLLHRISHYFFRANRKYVARLFWHLNFLLTGADISEPCDLGEGLLILSPPGTSIMGKAGRNLTLMPGAGLGGEVGRREDVGAGPGLPVLGDDVLLEPHSGILGPVRIGHRVHVTVGIGVTRDVSDDSIVEGPQPRFVRRRDLG